MTQEKEDLLLKDLCARLPYGVVLKVDYIINDETTYGEDVPATCDDKLLRINLDEFSVYTEWLMEYSGIGYIKPYLRPISSMTKEEYKEMQMVLGRGEFAVLMNKTSGLELWLESFDTDPTIWFDSLVDVQDWLNKKMFAYRTIDGYDMFELGLAIPAPEGMYK